MSLDTMRLDYMLRVACDNVEELANQYVDGELDYSTCRLFERHLEVCSSCREVVLELKQLVSTARSLEETRIPTDVSNRLREALKKRIGFEYSSQLRLLDDGK